MTVVLTRTWNDVARQVWPEARYVVGEGPFATVRGCGGKTTVLLHPTLEQARHALRHMHTADEWCQQRHVLIELPDGGPLDE